MQICIPVNSDEGLESTVCAHFGSAPFFMLVDTESSQCRAITNNNQHHAHGMCMPLAALQGESVDGMVVGGIGMGALMKLNAANIVVFKAEHKTVAETLAAYKAESLEPLQPSMACSQHGKH